MADVEERKIVQYGPFCVRVEYYSSIWIDQHQLPNEVHLMDDVDPKKSPSEEMERSLEKEFERLTILDSEWRKHFASQGKPPTDGPKLSSSHFLCE